MKSVFITGVTGQDGSIMVDYLLENTDCKIYGGVRRLSVKNYDNISHIKNERFKLIDYDASDPISIEDAIRKLKPDYVINFAANSFVGNSWDMPFNHFQVNTVSVLYLLEAIRKFSPQSRVYQASSSEMFGNVDYSPQDEKHPLKPCSPYGVSKCASHLYIKMYRESYGIYAVSGICFNHGSPVRGKEFIERKISSGVARIYNESLDLNVKNKIIPLKIGNIDSERDWSHAKDVVDGIWRILNQEIYNKDIVAEIGKEKKKNAILRQEELNNYNDIIINNIQDYVISSGKTYSIKFMIEESFKLVGLYGEWKGEKLNKRYLLQYRKDKDGNIIDDYINKDIVLVEIDERFYRPLDVNHLCGNNSKIRNELNWSPNYDIYSFVKELVGNDIKEILNYE
jgi:GDPmannose 4,6-dehydratase